jgi:hypothetical protein
MEMMIIMFSPVFALTLFLFLPFYTALPIFIPIFIFGVIVNYKMMRSMKLPVCMGLEERKNLLPLCNGLQGSFLERSRKVSQRKVIPPRLNRAVILSKGGRSLLKRGGFARLTALTPKMLALPLTEVIIIVTSYESSGENGFGGDERA